MNHNFILSAVIVGAIAALGVGITLWNGGTAPQKPVTLAQEDVVLPRFSTLAIAGNIAYEQNCALCHGGNAVGSGKGPPLLHDIYNPGHHNDDSFYRAVKTGTPRHHWNFGDMPPLPQVSRRQVAAIIRYIRELQETNGILYKQHTM